MGASEARVGVAVSGGPDSLALLLLAHAVRPGAIAAATVDHRLRPESGTEAAMVAQVCADLSVPHAILPVDVAPGNLQAEARAARYRALESWLAERGLAALATAHHADDQAETLLMRLNRGSGVAGLAGVRSAGLLPGGARVLRPLLGWRKAELEAVVTAAGLAPARDPSNSDPRYDRARLRQKLGDADWLDPLALAASAAHLLDADEAIVWAVQREWVERVTLEQGAVRYHPVAPRAIRLRVLSRAIGALGGEARGSALATLDSALSRGEQGNLGGVLARCEGEEWVLRPEPLRRG